VNVVNPSIYPAGVWGTCSAWWQGGGSLYRTIICLWSASFESGGAWGVVPDEGFVRYSTAARRDDLHLSSGFLLRS
jgi:hypothetical protein